MGGSILLGITSGLDIAVFALGIVLIYKTCRCINFAQVQLGIIPMLLLGKMVIDGGVSWYLAAAVALVLGLVIGLVSERLTVHLFARAGSQFVLVATLGVSQLILGFAYIQRLGAPATSLIAHGFPVPFHINFTLGSQSFFAQQVLTVIVVPVLTVGLYVYLRYTLTGKAIRAAASNNEASLLAGVRASRLSLLAWGAAGVMSTMAAVLIAPNNPSFDPSEFGTDLTLRALGAAALAGFTSFPLALGAAVGLSVIEEVVINITSNAVYGEVAVFGAIVVGLLLRRSKLLSEMSTSLGRGAALRPGIPPRIANTVGARGARIALALGLLAVAVVVYVIFSGDTSKLFDIEEVAVYCVAAASVSILAGLTGQFSLGQLAIVGFGAMVSAKLVTVATTDLAANLVICGGACALLACLICLPALRGSPITTAVTTLGFGAVAVAWLFTLNLFSTATGGFGASQVAPQRLPIIGGLGPGGRQYIVVLFGAGLLLYGSGLMVRSRWGQQMKAVRFSNRGATAIGIRPGIIFLAGVAVCGFVAGSAGVLDQVANGGFNSGLYAAEGSLTLFSIAVIGGLGSPAGAAFTALLIFGIPLFLQNIIDKIGIQQQELVLVLGGAGLIINLAANPGGFAVVGGKNLENLCTKYPRLGRTLGPRRAPTPVPAVITGVTARPVPTPADAAARGASSSSALSVRDLSISFGAVRALDMVTIDVRDGEVVGLIGNNGAGKTTLLNCVAGTLQADNGRVELFGRDVGGLGTVERARLGVGRTFQDAALFDGLTTEEILALAARRRVTTSVELNGSLTDAGTTAAVMAELGLEPYAKTMAAEVPTGVRRLIEVGVQVLRQPKLLLLDEPTAGLGQAEVEEFAPLLRNIATSLGCAVLMIEHDLPLMLGLAQRIYCLELGTVIAEGTPADIRNNPRVIESYFGSPTGVGARRSGVLPEPAPGATPSSQH